MIERRTQNPPMPSKSAAQARFMAAAAHNPRFARKAGIPQSVAKEFNRADQNARQHPSWHPKDKRNP